jgi:hypothetical protein
MEFMACRHASRGRLASEQRRRMPLLQMMRMMPRPHRGAAMWAGLQPGVRVPVRLQQTVRPRAPNRPEEVAAAAGGGPG